MTNPVTEKAQETADTATETADTAKETAESAKETTQDTANEATSKATGATDGVKGAVGGLAGTVKDQVGNVLSDAVKNTVQPVVQQMSEQAAKQAVEYAKREGPRLMKEQVLPPVMKSVGADTPGDLAKAGIAKVGESISDSGGLTGIAGKLMSKLGGGKGGGSATGYGQKRRMPIQQDVFVSVSLEDAYRAWTEYKRWTEYMHRANQVDPQIEEGDQEGEAKGSVRLTVTEKMWGFKRPFTAEVVSQTPNEHIRWKSTQGTKHVGVIAFHGIAPRLTMISVDIDHAPAGPIEKIARGARFDKRAIRADLHRFKGWVEHKSPEEMDEIEGWLGTIEDGQITKSHEPASELEGEDAPNGQEKETPDSTEMEPDEPEDEEGLGEGQPKTDDDREDDDEVAQPPEEEDVAGSDSGHADEGQQEEPQDGQEGDEEDGEDDQAEGEDVEEPADEEEEPEPAADEEEEEPVDEEEALEDMGKNDLIALARKRGLTVRGNREDLIQRLQSDEEDDEEEDDEDEEERPLPAPRSRAKRPASRASR